MKISRDDLFQVCKFLLVNAGEDTQNANIAADAMVRADLRGISTHGSYLITKIYERKDADLICLPTDVRIIKKNGSACVIDGCNGLGQIAAYIAMKESVNNAKKTGTALTLVRNMNNAGYLGYFTQIAAENGMIGIMGGNAAPAMAPWGGIQACFGTNPLSIAVPIRNSDPLILDMSSSVAARGKIRKAAREGRSIPSDWAMDEAGMPTDDPKKALKGTLSPIGGPKGSGLAFMIDIIAGVLSGSKYGADIGSFHNTDAITGTGVFCQAIDISSFCDLEYFYDSVSSYCSYIKNIKKAEGVFDIFLPGEIERRTEERNKVQGVEVDSLLTKSLNHLLDKAGSNLYLKEKSNV